MLEDCTICDRHGKPSRTVHSTALMYTGPSCMVCSPHHHLPSGGNSADGVDATNRQETKDGAPAHELFLELLLPLRGKKSRSMPSCCRKFSCNLNKRKKAKHPSRSAETRDRKKEATPTAALQIISRACFFPLHHHTNLYIRYAICCLEVVCFGRVGLHCRGHPSRMLVGLCLAS